MSNRARDLKRACEADLASDDPDRVANAMAFCEDASGRCFHAGNCTFDGECFQPRQVGFREACREIDALCARVSPEVADWLRIARDAMAIQARGVT